MNILSFQKKKKLWISWSYQPLRPIFPTRLISKPRIVNSQSNAPLFFINPSFLFTKTKSQSRLLYCPLTGISLAYSAIINIVLSFTYK